MHMHTLKHLMLGKCVINLILIVYTVMIPVSEILFLIRVYRFARYHYIRSKIQPCYPADVCRSFHPLEP